MSMSILEVLECAHYNFANLNRITGRKLGDHPIFILAMEQLNNVIKQLESGKSPDQLMPEEGEK